MRYIKCVFLLSVLFVISLCLAADLHAQSDVEKLVKQGIALHDIGDYAGAIALYREGLELEPRSELLSYELAYSYLSAENYDSAIYFSNRAIRHGNHLLLQAFNIKGSALDYSGKPDKAIRVYKKGLRKCGEDYLLHHNIACTYYHQKKYESAEEALLNAIALNYGHASSHLLLGNLKNLTNRPSQTLLCLYYFLLIEPASERSIHAYQLLQQQYKGQITRDPKDTSNITIRLNPEGLEDDFGAIDMLVAMLFTEHLIDQAEEKTEMELFISQTQAFFLMLGEMNAEKPDKYTGFWWSFYVDLFNDLAQSDHIDTFAYYISMSSSQEAEEWVKQHESNVEAMIDWLNNRE